MHKLFLTILLSSNFMTSAEAGTRYQVQPQANEQQVIGWKDGVQMTDDVQPKSVVRLVSVTDDLPSKPATFRIYLLNLSDKAIVFGPKDVSIELPDGITVAMTSPEEIDARLRRDIKRRQALATLGNALSEGSADGQTSGSFQHSGMTSDGTLYSGTGTYSGYDPALARQQQQVAREQTQRTEAAIQDRKMAGAQALSGLIRQTSVPAGEMMGGIVAFNVPASSQKAVAKGLVKVLIKAGDVVHSFESKVTKVP